jgi:hypothetical protein
MSRNFGLWQRTCTVDLNVDLWYPVTWLPTESKMSLYVKSEFLSWWAPDHSFAPNTETILLIGRTANFSGLAGCWKVDHVRCQPSRASLAGRRQRGEQGIASKAGRTPGYMDVLSLHRQSLQNKQCFHNQYLHTCLLRATERREGCFVDWPGGRSTAPRPVDPLAT